MDETRALLVSWFGIWQNRHLKVYDRIKLLCGNLGIEINAQNLELNKYVFIFSKNDKMYEFVFSDSFFDNTPVDDCVKLLTDNIRRII